MKAVTERTALIVRMQKLFSGVELAGTTMTVADLSYEAGTVDLEFDVSESQANQFGTVQGGTVATLLEAVSVWQVPLSPEAFSQCRSPR